MKFKKYVNNGKLYFLLIFSQSHIVTQFILSDWIIQDSRILEFSLFDWTVVEYMIWYLSQSNYYLSDYQSFTWHFHIFSIKLLVETVVTSCPCVFSSHKWRLAQRTWFHMTGQSQRLQDYRWRILFLTEVSCSPPLSFQLFYSWTWPCL